MGGTFSVKPRYNICETSPNLHPKRTDFWNSGKFKTDPHVSVLNVSACMCETHTFHTITASRLKMLCLILRRKTKSAVVTSLCVLLLHQTEQRFKCSKWCATKKRPPCLHKATGNGFPIVPKTWLYWLYWNRGMGSISTMEITHVVAIRGRWAECVKSC